MSFQPDTSWMVVVNPVAGGGKVSKEWHKIEQLLISRQFPFTARFTETRNHATEIAREAIAAGCRRIVVVGGDGTLNEVANGILSQAQCPSDEISLAMIPVGTGNDWGRMYHIPDQYTKAVDTILAGRTILQDAGMIDFHEGDQQESRYFVNTAGLGFDARVVQTTNQQKEKGRTGKALYYLNLIENLVDYHAKTIEVEVDGKLLNHQIFTISIGIGKYSGGGMQQTPKAIPDDGLLDITLIKSMSKGEIILNLKKLYDGSLLSHPKIIGLQGKIVRVKSDFAIPVEADGESLGHVPATFSILPRCLHIVVGQSYV
jgi:YegS/Rv2252/BmrU family lipid kinase